MRTFVFAILSAFFGALVSWHINRRTIEKQRRTIRALRMKNGTVEKPKMETTKKVMWVCLIMGFLWVWCSYILAWMDRIQIAESLSATAVTEIIGVVLAYCIKSAVENLSKNNHWPDKVKTDEQGLQPEREEPSDVGV